jgi:DNA-binding protein YbaB
VTPESNFSLDEAVAELRRQQQRLMAARASLQDVKSKVTSKDGMVTITLDARGEISAIAFNTQKFRRMAPAELGAALVEVIGKARTQARERVADAYQSFIPPNLGLGLEDLIAGKGDLNAMFDEAVRKANDIMAQGPGADSRGTSGRAGNVNGNGNGRQANTGGSNV